MRAPKYRSQAGFTLVEAVIVVAIVLTIAALTDSLVRALVERAPQQQSQDPAAHAAAAVARWAARLRATSGDVAKHGKHDKAGKGHGKDKKAKKKDLKI